MTQNINFRFAQTTDAERLSEIYSYYVLNTPISFEYDPPSAVEFAERIKKIGLQYPYLVCEVDGIAVGYAYASEFKSRIAYQWDIETSIYIDPAYHRLHIASAFYELLFKMLNMQGYCKAYAIITTPNPASEKFHEKQGFRTIGIFCEIGYKLNAWRDVVYMEKSIFPVQSEPKPPLSLRELNRNELDRLLIKESDSFNRL